jgi:hypothetical protein
MDAGFRPFAGFKLAISAYAALSATTIESVELPIPPQVEAGGLSLHFALPEAKTESGSLATRLSERPATYWKLDVTASVPGVDYAADFLIPVYEET